MQEHKKLYGQTPDNFTADAGYGSEEIINYLEQNKIEGFVKFGSFDREQKKKLQAKKLLPPKPTALQRTEGLLLLPDGSADG